MAALVWTLIVAASCLVGIGYFLIPSALQATRAIADRERARLTAWSL
ncbi:hypothetical protein [Kribbella qitaiheensis]|nr:hypothetical protein [Kribbella qitaiheensis]